MHFPMLTARHLPRRHVDGDSTASVTPAKTTVHPNSTKRNGWQSCNTKRKAPCQRRLRTSLLFPHPISKRCRKWQSHTAEVRENRENSTVQSQHDIHAPYFPISVFITGFVFPCALMFVHHFAYDKAIANRQYQER